MNIDIYNTSYRYINYIGVYWQQSNLHNAHSPSMEEGERKHRKEKEQRGKGV